MPRPAAHPDFTSKDIIGLFYHDYEKQEAEVRPLLEMLTLPVESTRDEEEHKDLGGLGPMRVWDGGREPQPFPEYGYNLRNVKYEKSVDFALEDLKFERLGLINRRINELNNIAAINARLLLTPVVIAGESQLCYDGQYFYDTDHNASSTNQSNIVTVDVSELPVEVHGANTDPSVEEMRKSIFQAIARMKTFTNDSGLHIKTMAKNFMIHVPPAFEEAALGAVSAPVLTHGQTNTLMKLKATFEVFADPLLTWTTKFAVHDVGNHSKPFIHQVQRETEFSGKAEGSDYEHDNDAHQYGVMRKEAIGYGQWADSVLVSMI